jgi:Ca2+-binding EF-hand superfamily protein
MAEFKATDTNKDGQLSRAEIDVRVKRMAAGSKQFTPATAKTLTDRYFALADADKSGGISPAEWQGFTRAIASRYDTNHDGVVSLQERQAARAAAVSEAKGR